MSLAPEPYRSACLAVMRRAIVDARFIAWGTSPLPKGRQEQVADLMDAVHNIPYLLNNWERCDQRLLRLFLESYDEKWVREGDGVRLANLYDEYVAGTRPPGS